MSAAEALRAARAAGIQIGIDSNDLVLEAAAQPSPEVLDLVAHHKAEILTLLRPTDDGWSAEDWQVFFVERAGIAEFEGGQRRSESEARAMASCVAEWLNRNPVRSPPGRCLVCGGGDQAHDPLLPYGLERTGNAWLHPHCWPDWYARQEARAIAALAAMGIGAPTDLPHDSA